MEIAGLPGVPRASDTLFDAAVMGGRVRSHARRLLPLVCWLLAMTLHSAGVTAAIVSPLALGAYIADAPGDATKLDHFIGMVGATPGIVMWYQDWEHAGNREFDPAKLNAVVARGAMPMITWEPWDATGGAESARLRSRRDHRRRA